MTDLKAPYFGKLTDRMNNYREAVLTKNHTLMQSVPFL